jgi:hypothetical protein
MLRPLAKALRKFLLSLGVDIRRAQSKPSDPVKAATTAQLRADVSSGRIARIKPRAA